MIRASRLATFAAVLGTATAPAFAWGPQAHRVIARVAESRLTPAARAGVRALLLDGDTMAEVANWADHEGHDAVPGSAPWHYVNVPIAAPHYDPRFCGRSGCVVERIGHFRAALADKATPEKERRRALLFLIHLVSDVHQPLHVGDHDDRGGNLTQIRFEGSGTNMHRLWDSDLIRHIGGDDRAWAGRVEHLITPESLKAWSSGSAADWADESLQAAKVAYRDPNRMPNPPASGVELGETYVRLADPILREQMARASVRLANELNAIFR